MRSAYTESVVAIPTKPFHRALKIVMIATLVMAGLLLIMSLLIPAVVLGALGLALLLWVNRKIDCEYDYVHTNNAFDVDLVIRGSSRRHLCSVNLEQVVLIAPEDSGDMDIYRRIRAVDYSAEAEPERCYAMVYSVNGSQKKLLLQLDERMHRSLKQWIPGKVK